MTHDGPLIQIRSCRTQILQGRLEFTGEVRDRHIPISTEYADGLYASTASAQTAKAPDRLTENVKLTEVDVRDYPLHPAI